VFDLTDLLEKFIENRFFRWLVIAVIITSATIYFLIYPDKAEWLYQEIMDGIDLLYNDLFG